MRRIVVLFSRVLFLTLLLAGNVTAQISDKTVRALQNQDLGMLYSIYKADVNERKGIENYLCTVVDWEQIPYEELIAIRNGGNTQFDSLVEYYVAEKEIEIIRYVMRSSAEELGKYIDMYPRRLPAIHNFMQRVFFAGLDSLSYEELDYLNRKFDYPDMSEIKKSVAARSDERFEFAKSNIDEYCSIERAYRDRLALIVKVSAYQYLYSRFQNVAEYYSTIGLVPDDTNSIIRQFQRIVDAYFVPEDFCQQIQDDVDKYNEAINRARTEYVKECGVKGIVKSNVKTPEIKGFRYDQGYAVASSIPKGRADYKASQEAKSELAEVASWFVGSFWAGVGKGVLDVLTMDDLAISEIAARKEYMEYVYSQLEQVINEYCNGVEADIDKQIIENQSKFKKHVNRK